MIKHIVMLKLKEFDSAEEKEKHARKIKSGLELLVDKIDELNAIEVGLNLSTRQSAFDIVLIAVFDDMGALDRYREHHDHIKILNMILDVTERTAVVDYEF